MSHRLAKAANAGYAIIAITSGYAAYHSSASVGNFPFVFVLTGGGTPAHGLGSRFHLASKTITLLKRGE